MTNLIRCSLLLSLVGCSSSKAPSAGSGSERGSAVVATGSGSGSAAPTPAPAAATTAPPCPDEGPKLNERVAALIGDGLKVDDVSLAICVAGRFPEPAWAIGARYWKRTPDDSQLVEREMLVDASGKVTWSDERDLPPAAEDSGGPLTRKALDLDADGSDELIETSGYDRRGYAIETLVVLRRAGGAWQHALERQLAYDNSAADSPPVVSCEATWAITALGGGKHAIVLEPKIKPARKADECVMVKETWVPGGPDGKLVKQLTK